MLRRKKISPQEIWKKKVFYSKIVHLAKNGMVIFYMLTLIYILHILFRSYTFLLLVRIFGSWFPALSSTRFFRFVAFYTDPYLQIFRKWIPTIGMFDFSPMVALIALQIAQRILFSLILSL